MILLGFFWFFNIAKLIIHLKTLLNAKKTFSIFIKKLKIIRINFSNNFYNIYFNLFQSQKKNKQ